MTPDLPETTELQAFLAVADSGSVAAAATALGVPRATVSRRLARLEERLGARLFRRTSRRVVITDAGRDLDPHARRTLAAAAEAAEALHRAEGPPRGLLRISVPPAADTLFDEVLVRFVGHFPQVRVEVERSTRNVDLLAGGFDVALRASTQLDPGLVARKLASGRVGLWASADYLRARGAPATVADLVDHDCLVGFRGERPATHWPLLAGGQVAIQPRLAANDLQLLARAAAAGHGVALLPRRFADEHPLVAVLPDQVGATATLALVYAERSHVAPVVRAFVDFVVDAASSWVPRLG